MDIYYFRAIANTLGIEWDESENFPIAKVMQELEKFRQMKLLLFTCPDCGYNLTFREFANEAE